MEGQLLDFHEKVYGVSGHLVIRPVPVVAFYDEAGQRGMTRNRKGNWRQKRALNKAKHQRNLEAKRIITRILNS